MLGNIYVGPGIVGFIAVLLVIGIYIISPQTFSIISGYYYADCYMTDSDSCLASGVTVSASSDSDLRRMIKIAPQRNCDQGICIDPPDNYNTCTISGNNIDDNNVYVTATVHTDNGLCIFGISVFGGPSVVGIENPVVDLKYVPVNMCEDVICGTSVTTCADGYNSICENPCETSTGQCGQCLPDCTGHTQPQVECYTPDDCTCITQTGVSCECIEGNCISSPIDTQTGTLLLVISIILIIGAVLMAYFMWK